MPIDPSAVGTTLPPVTMKVERGRLRSFARAIGESDPIYSDLDAARAAGHPDLPVPPTFLFGVELESADPFGYLAELGVDLRTVLHGEQRFAYHRMVHAGEELTAHAVISDVYAKRGGTLEFIVKDTRITRGPRADNEAVADLTSVIVVRHPAQASEAER